MLNKVARYALDDDATLEAESRSETMTIDLAGVLRFLRRNIWLIAATSIACGLIAAAYVKVTPKTYSASANLLIDTRKLDLFQAQAVIEDSAINTAAVESQMQILKSDDVARQVLRNTRLDLLQTEEFGGEQPTPARQFVLFVRQLWGGSPVDGPADAAAADEAAIDPGFLHGVIKPLLPGRFNPFPVANRSESDVMQRAVQRFQEKLMVSRIGLSYVIQIRFTSEDPELAAAVANEVASTYINQRLEAKLQMAEHAGKWLEGRIADLRNQATDSDRAVQTFRVDNNIINAGDQLITDQQVQELSKQRILAEATVTEAKARYERMQMVNSSQNTDVAVTDAIDNAIIVRLQERYLDLVKQRNDLAGRYGDGHRTVAALEREISLNRADVNAELRRLEESYKNEYEIALTRVAQLQDALDRLLGNSAKSLQAQVELRELQSKSNSYSSLYNSFLERYVQTIQQQSFPVTEAKVITPAARPLKSAGAGNLAILGTALAFGGLLGCGIAVGRDLLDKTIRTSAQLEKVAGTRCLGILPNIRKDDGHTLDADVPPTPENSPFKPIPAHMRYVIDAPFSQYSETIRRMKVAATAFKRNAPMQVVGMVSSMAGEGKTTVSANLAFLIATSANVRTLLVDLDLRNPSQTRNLTKKGDGLVQVLEGRRSLRETVVVHEETGLHFLPAGVHRPFSNTSDFLVSEAMEKLMAEVRDLYDYVILDLPPLVPLVDVQALAHQVDGFILVSEFQKTQAEILSRAMRMSPNVREKMIGAVLNKVDVQAIGKLDTAGATYYQSKYYLN